MQAPFTKGAIIPDSYIGNNVNCTIDVQLDERTVTFPDGEVEWAEELTDSDGEKNKTEWTTLTIGGVEYTVLAAVSEQPKKVEAKVEPVEKEEVKEEVKPAVEEVKQVDEVKQADE